jgi:two-component system, cell cycle response regulator CtrA
MQILSIEDDVALASSMMLALRCEGFDFHLAELGAEGIKLAKQRHYDVIILDLHLPDIYGLDVLKALRTAKVDTPVLVLSADATIEARVNSLDAGADDYMTKPCRRIELSARLCAIARRSRVHAQSLIEAGKITVNLDMKTVDVSGCKVRLTIKEYEVLECLMLKKGTTLTKLALLNYLYGDMDTRPEKIIDVFVCKLRKKLAAAMDGDDYIRTVWARGYMFCGPSMAEAVAA